MHACMYTHARMHACTHSCFSFKKNFKQENWHSVNNVEVGWLWVMESDGAKSYGTAIAWHSLLVWSPHLQVRICFALSWAWKAVMRTTESPRGSSSEAWHLSSALGVSIVHTCRLRGTLSLTLTSSRSCTVTSSSLGQPKHPFSNCLKDTP